MYQTLLVAVDGSTTSRLALSHAAALARMAGSTVVLLHIVDDVAPFLGASRAADVRPQFVQAGRTLLDDARALPELSGLAVQTVLVECHGERICELIVQQAQAVQADLIVLGTHGRRGVDRLLIGSDAEQVARTAPVPVMLVRQSA